MSSSHMNIRLYSPQNEITPIYTISLDGYPTGVKPDKQGPLAYSAQTLTIQKRMGK
ncbi:MAG: hypothetical protein JAY99_09285 [Candidatus Thiodiazotropha lotti]|uniref:hypothetical protein n=1 Tax=Candidatus Thiodiazotropha endoloripes TaxID=1818881 RepID=UPI0012D8436D|nr:hypothetical protein [Candidatus Thiodiazotropha endoloripes]MCG7991682.1 hypothetical protein [Candidatus Thiodiazotropha lotti]MCG7999706.1 hypothetical protein [Candidatus Thiodiazotropha lotti]MCW4183337.1 hypothetical protein [Candidatus Thiodiazotropha weberae]MCW4191474.1 hypothetical protein [Candidatus Thiodiazotropha weberae]